MTSPPEPQTWRDAVKALLLAAVGVAAAFYALVLIVTAVFLSGLDIDFDLNLNFTHPHFSPDGLEGEDAVREFMAVQMLAHGPETVFVIQRGESTQAAAARFLKFCLKAWGRRPPSDSSGAVPLFAEWLDRAAAAHAAYAQKYGAADAARSAHPEGDPWLWTDATPGARYRYVMARAQVDVFMCMAGLPQPRMTLEMTDLDVDEEEASPSGVFAPRMATRFLFEWK